MNKLLSIILLLANFSAISFAGVCNGTYKDIITVLPSDWIVTSTTGGRHNKGSLHYQGKAVDLSCKFKTDLDVLLLTDTLEELGYRVRDERVHPIGQAIWHGAHLHISVPDCMEESPDID